MFFAEPKRHPAPQSRPARAEWFTASSSRRDKIRYFGTESTVWPHGSFAGGNPSCRCNGLGDGHLVRLVFDGQSRHASQPDTGHCLVLLRQVESIVHFLTSVMDNGLRRPERLIPGRLRLDARYCEVVCVHPDLASIEEAALLLRLNIQHIICALGSSKREGVVFRTKLGVLSVARVAGLLFALQQPV